MSRAGPSHTYRSVSGIGVVASVDGRGVADPVEAGDDDGEFELAPATPDPDELGAPAQPAVATRIAAIATSDRVIG